MIVLKERLFNMRYIEYHTIIEYYSHLFGRSSILVLPYEWLRDDPIKFINKIRSFVHLEPVKNISSDKLNQGQTAAICEFRRMLNRWIVSPNQPGKVSKKEKLADSLCSKVNRFIPNSYHKKADRKLAIKIEKLVSEFYVDSNKRTEDLTGLDLGSLGYDL